MNLAITGGAGFLGYHLANKLASDFDKIYIIDIQDIDFKEYPENISYHKIDVRDLDLVVKIFKDSQFVIHAASALPLWKRKEIFEINVQGTRNVLQAAYSTGVTKVIYVSSTAVYGIPRTHPIYEDSALIGVGPYGESKIVAEKVCLRYRKKGYFVPVVRPKTFLGTGRLGVFQILYDWVKDGKKIPIIGNGKNRYQLLEVEDLVNAIRMILFCDERKANDTFNIGAEEFGTVYEDLTALCNYAKTGARVMPTPSWIVKPFLFAFDVLGISPLYKWVYGTADKDSFVAIHKIKSVLGWKPKYSNAQALIRSYQWYLDNWEKLKGTGITHRVAWSQGILGIFKKIL
jgi:nucleoside-diphosphate-sugar epimerase